MHAFIIIIIFCDGKLILSKHTNLGISQVHTGAVTDHNTRTPPGGWGGSGCIIAVTSHAKLESAPPQGYAK